MQKPTLFCFLLAVSLYCSQSTQAGITIDYSDDMAGGNFFGTNATARAALEQAVADINAVLNFSGSATADSVVGNGPLGSSATYDFELSYRNPTTGTFPATRPSAVLGVDEILLYVGVRPLGGNTLGVGGRGGVGLESALGSQIGGSMGATDFSDAVANANALAAANFDRGDGPVMTSLNGNFGTNIITFTSGPTVGSLALDSDTNNDGTEDFDSWHFDHTTTVEAGKFDFYSVALHEVLHSVGIGTSDSWDGLVDGTNWNGANASALANNGVGIIDADGGHIAENIMSTSIVDGSIQEVVMDPNITPATRKFLTDLDVAFLRDIGFSNASVVAVPEPSSIAVLALIGCVFVGRRRQR